MIINKSDSHKWLQTISDSHTWLQIKMMFINDYK